jgi:hypothetical protein
MTTMPAVLIQRFALGGAITGVSPVGTLVDSEETIYRGRIRKISGLTDGGLVDVDTSIVCGYRVSSILASVPGVTALAFHVVDHDGHSTYAGTLSLTSGNGYIDWRNNGILVPPGFSFKVIGTGTLSGDGQIMFVFANGWHQSGFENASILGKSISPPGP